MPDPITVADQQTAASSPGGPPDDGGPPQVASPERTDDSTPPPPSAEASGPPATDGSTFGSYYYRHDCGTPYERSDHWLEFFGGIADHVTRELRPLSVLDAGCATGMLVEALRRRGVDAEGVDISAWAVEQAPPEVRAHCRVASLTEPLPRRYDLVVCIEVVEHMSAADGRAAVANMAAATDRILLSTSPVDYGEPTHLNVQPPEHWSALLAAHGFARNVDYDASYVTPWAALYERSSAPLPEVVRTYDRAWWRLRHEVDELRAKVLAMQSDLEAAHGGTEALADPDEEAREQATAREQAAAEQALAEADGLRRERQELHEEILRLRDLVVGGESELGAARGRVVELEAALESYRSTASRLDAVLRSRSWRVMWLAGAPIRKLRHR